MLLLNFAFLFRRAALAEELAVLRQVDGFASKGVSPPRGKNGFSRYNCRSFYLLPISWTIFKVYLYKNHETTALLLEVEVRSTYIPPSYPHLWVGYPGLVLGMSIGTEYLPLEPEPITSVPVLVPKIRNR